MNQFVLLFLLLSLGVQAQTRKTTVSVRGEDFYINDQITLKGKTYNGMRLEGLLPNSRMVQGTFDDSNRATRTNWNYADTGVWDADRNTNEFVAAMPVWREHGLLAVTLNLQGGSPYGYSGNPQTWVNSAFRADGSLDKKYMNRLAKILNRADELGMVVILGYFYFGQDQHLTDEKAVIAGVRKATKWVLTKGYRNVILEINNECDINRLSKKVTVNGYNHAILDAPRVHELINLAKSIRQKRRGLLVSTSFVGGSIPTDNVLAVSDFVLLHGNSVKEPEKIADMVKTVRAKATYKGSPLVFNEDDHFDFDQPMNNFVAATGQHASWGYFDYRMKNESFVDGYQSVPVDWGIESARKRGFFELLKKMVQ